MRILFSLLTILASTFSNDLISQIHQLDWAITGGSSDTEILNGLGSDGKGNVYLSGDFRGTVDFDPGPAVYNLTSSGIDDIFIQKLDSNGNFLWATSVGSTGDDQTYSLAVDPFGNVLITGYYQGTVDFDPGSGITNLTSAGANDIYILKLNSIGDFIWARSLGGAHNDYGLKIETDINGNIYTTGSFRLTADFDPGIGTQNHVSNGNSDVYISKLDSSGNYVWSKSFGGISIDRGGVIATDSDGNVYLGGSYRDTVDFDPGIGVSSIVAQGAFDFFVQKMDRNGNMVWVKSFGGTSQEYIRGIAVDDSKNVYLTGEFSHTADFDPGVGIFNLTSSGAAGYKDMFIEKLDSLGNLSWAHKIGDSLEEVGYDIAVNQIGNITITGTYTGGVDFDPSSSVYNLNSLGNFDVFVAEFSNSGNFNWASSVGGHSFDIATSLEIDKDDNILVAGYYSSDSIDFDPGVTNNWRINNGATDFYAFKLNKSLVGLNGFDNIFKFKLFPNPTKGEFEVSLNQFKGEIINLSIIDLQGRVIEERKISCSSNESLKERFNLTDSSNGVYFIAIRNENGVEVKKLILARE